MKISEHKTVKDARKETFGSVSCFYASGCVVMKYTLSVWYYKSFWRRDTAVRGRIVQLANARIQNGVNPIHALLKRKDWKENNYRMDRI